MHAGESFTSVADLSPTLPKNHCVELKKQRRGCAGMTHVYRVLQEVYLHRRHVYSLLPMTA
jgi:hypothetical protein